MRIGEGSHVTRSCQARMSEALRPMGRQPRAKRMDRDSQCWASRSVCDAPHHPYRLTRHPDHSPGLAKMLQFNWGSQIIGIMNQSPLSTIEIGSVGFVVVTEPADFAFMA